MKCSIAFVPLFFCAAFLLSSPALAGPQYVINISIDGLGSSYLQTLLNSGAVPNLQRMKNEGSSTMNARNDYDSTVTLPNHTTMLTGRGVAGPAGHNWTGDTDLDVYGQTLQSKKGSYVATVFDVAHDNGLRTGLFAGKSKFSLFDTSVDGSHGAEDIIAPNYGRDKIDTYQHIDLDVTGLFSTKNSNSLTDQYIAAMSSNPFNYSMLHFADPDQYGHFGILAGGWGNTDYMNAVKSVDANIGRVLNLVETNATLKGKTTILLTADHGGTGRAHDTVTDSLNYTIPFFAWGAGVLGGTDLYDLNPTTRLNPGTGRPDYQAAGQPIRDGDLANLSLSLLGLGPVPGSTIDYAQDMVVPEPSTISLLLMASLALAWHCCGRRRTKK